MLTVGVSDFSNIGDHGLLFLGVQQSCGDCGTLDLVPGWMWDLERDCAICRECCDRGEE